MQFALLTDLEDNSDQSPQECEQSEDESASSTSSMMEQSESEDDFIDEDDFGFESNLVIRSKPRRLYDADC